MRPWHYVAIGCSAFAVILTIILERRPTRRANERAEARVAWIVLLSCLGVCAAIAYAFLAYVLQFGLWGALALAIPLGFLVLLIICIGES